MSLPLVGRVVRVQGDAGPEWHATLEPHAAIMFKRIFPQIKPETTGQFVIRDTPRNCADLDWFIQRYPLDVRPPDAIAQGKAAYIAEQEILVNLRSPNYKPIVRKLSLPLRQYQALAVDTWLARRGILNGDDLGLGKSAEAIGAFADPRTLPAIVVCHPHLQTQWQREIAKFIPELRTHVIKTTKPYDLKQGSARDPDVAIITYTKLPTWVESLSGWARSIVLDECQELRKTGSQKYNAAKALALCCEYRIGLSATPIYNEGGEIFNVMDVLQPGCLGSHDEFATQWCTYVSGPGGGKWLLNDSAAMGVFLRSEGLMIRRTREEVGRELPPLSRFTQEVEAEERAIAAIKGQAGALARLILKHDKATMQGQAMQAAGEFSELLRRQTGIAKAPAVAEFVKILLDSGEKVLLGGWHHAVYDIWKELLVDYRPAFYTGRESPTAKNKARDDFLRGNTRLMIMSVRSGVGVDGLQGPHNQFIGRVHRDGQAQSVFAYFLVAPVGSDPVICDTLGLKKQQHAGIIDPEDRDSKLLESLARDRIFQLAQDFLQRHC
jgi:hypothetical protein